MDKWFKWVEMWLNKRMAKKISALPPASIPLVGGERVALVQSGTTVQAAVSSLSAGGGAANTAFTNVNNRFTTGQTFSGPITATRATLSALALSGSILTAPGRANLFMGSHVTGAGNRTLYGSSNIGLGEGSGIALTIGTSNLMIGSSTGNKITSGSGNVLLGANAGAYLTTASHNLIVGTNAGFYVTSSNNALLGRSAGGAIVEGIGRNVMMGYRSGSLSLTASNNIFIGSDSGRRSNGQDNIFIGGGAGEATNAYGYQMFSRDNVFIGLSAGNKSQASGAVLLGKYAGLFAANYDVGTIAIGSNAARYAQRGSTVVGYRAMLSSTSFYNTVVGFKAGESGVGGYSTLLGAYAGSKVDGIATGQFSTFLGYRAGQDGGGATSVNLGSYAGRYVATGQDNIFIGHQTGTLINTISSISNAIVIGARAKALSSNELVLGSTLVPLLTNASAVTPAAPFTFLQIRLNGRQLKIPLYN